MLWNQSEDSCALFESKGELMPTLLALWKAGHFGNPVDTLTIHCSLHVCWLFSLLALFIVHGGVLLQF